MKGNPKINGGQQLPSQRVHHGYERSEAPDWKPGSKAVSSIENHASLKKNQQVILSLCVWWDSYKSVDRELAFDEF